VPADQCTRGRTDRGADRGARYAAVDRGVLRRAAGLTPGVLPTLEVIVAELIEAAPLAGKRHDARAARRRDHAAAERKRGDGKYG
jgi:hypothetical protein